jgi:RNA polymerase sigma factor (sigma-70 family)
MFKGSPRAEMHDSLEELLDRVVARDPRAVEAFVRRACPSATRVVRQVLGSQHPDVSDVVQEAMFATLDALPDFRRQCTVTHFVWRVAALTAMNARRRLRLREQVTPGTDVADEYPSDEPSPLGLTLAAQRREVLRQLLDELPAVHAEVLALHCVLGFTIAETASATGAPINTVRSRLLAAKAALRERLSQNAELSELVRGVS